MASTQSGMMETRARRRAQGFRAMEVFAHEKEIAILDRLKTNLGLSSRSEVIRVLIANAEMDNLTPADIAVLERGAA